MFAWVLAVVSTLIAVVSFLKARSSTRQAGEVANFVIGVLFDEELRETTAAALVEFVRTEVHPTPEMLAYMLRHGIIHNAGEVWAQTHDRNATLLWGMSQAAQARRI